MKKILLFCTVLFATVVTLAQGPQTIINVPINTQQTEPGVLALPNDYSSTSGTYPLLIFLHGVGEAGTNPAAIYNNSGSGGPSYFIAHNQWPASFTNPANGQAYKYIVLSPQAVSFSTSGPQLNYVISYMIANYRVDINRIYLTGLSAGGVGLYDYTTRSGVTPQYLAAATVPMSAAIGSPTQTAINNTIADNIHVWGFGSETDVYGINTHVYLSGAYNGNGGTVTGLGALGRFTGYTGGHCCWGNFYNPTYHETINGHSMNIYEWLLQYSRGSGGPQNQLPIANAGTDKTIAIPTNSVTLNGSGTDPDGTITSYSWSKVSGPNQFTISNATIQNPVITNLTGGTYIFRLTVTDNSGGTGIDDVVVQVNGASGIPIPGRVEAEFYSLMQGIGVETTTDVGGGQDVGYTEVGDWMNYDITAATPGTYTVSFRVASPNTGTQLQLRKADGTVLTTITIPQTGGWQTWATVSSTVTLPAGAQTLRIYSLSNGWNINWFEFSSTQNQPPVANAGPDQTIALPVNSVTLSGSGTDPDGTVTGYSWSKTSGPAQFTISNAAIAAPVLSNLVQGSYVFRLTITDNGGATAVDDITITVNAATAGNPVSTRIQAESYNSQSGTGIENTSDVGGGQNVGYIDAGDWMDYNVNISSTGNATINFRVASPSNGTQLQLRKSDGTILTTVTMPSTGAWQVWETLTTTVALPAGAQTLRIYAVTGGWNINWFELAGQAAQNQPPVANAGVDKTITLPTSSAVMTGSGTDADGTITTYLWSKVSGPAQFTISSAAIAAPTISNLVAGTYIFRLTVTDNIGATGTDDVTIQVNASSGLQIPGRIEAENYNSQSGIGVEATTDAGGGQDVGYTEAGDWMDYPVNVTAAGTYTVNFRVASPNSGTQIQLRKQDGTVLATVTNPQTGGWQNWTTVSATVSLTAGTQTLRIYAQTFGWNLNWFEFTQSAGRQAQVITESNNVEVVQPITDSLNVYPNPLSDQFTLKVNNNRTGMMNVQIIDMSGKTRKEFNIVKNQAQFTQGYLSISGLPAGVYILQVRMDQWIATRKILKY